MTFTSFKDKKLYSKKEWILPDSLTNVLYYFIPIFIIIYAYCLIVSIFDIKKNKIFIIPLLILLSCYFVDLLSACYHCLYIDGSYNYLHNIQYKNENGFLIVNTDMGYASCHHIFPSNWKDIKDTTLFSTMFILVFVPLLFFVFFIKNPIIKCFLIFCIGFIILSCFSHKYAHEKLHNRYVPLWFNLLIEFGIFLDPKIHEKHHIENNYNWSLLNGMSDSLFNIIVRNVCTIFNICPFEETQYNVKLYNNDIINIKFIGDIEGIIQCRMKNNLFVEP